MISSTQLRRIYSNLFKNVSLRTIRHRLQKDLNMPSRRAAKKPLFTDKMKQKRLEFAYKYKDWTKEMWNSVMFSDESTFKCIRSSCNRVRHPPGSNRFASKYTFKTVKHPDFVMLWGTYSGKMGKAGVYFLPKKCTMNSERYIELLETHFLQMFSLHECQIFMQDGAPCHKSKKVMKWFKDHNITLLEWPGNSPDFNPIENCWNYIKNKLSTVNTSSIQKLIMELKLLWISIKPEYFRSLSESMPERLRQVIKNKGKMTKY